LRLDEPLDAFAELYRAAEELKPDRRPIKLQ
jgi:hypothetical protein